MTTLRETLSCPTGRWDQLAAAICRRHDDTHTGPLTTCTDPICEAAIAAAGDSWADEVEEHLHQLTETWQRTHDQLNQVGRDLDQLIDAHTPDTTVQLDHIRPTAAAVALIEGGAA